MIAFVREIARVMNAPCRSHSEMMSAALDGRLPLATRVGLRFHTVLCGPCRRLFAQFTLLQSMARRLSRDAQDRILRTGSMPADVRDRLAARLRSR